MAADWTRRAAAWILLPVLLATAAAPAGAQTETAQTGTAQTGPSYEGAPYVQVVLGSTNLDQGIRLLGDQPDGLTTTLPDTSGRQSMPNASDSDRFFYFEVNDSYIMGGKNVVRLTVTYRDTGLTWFYMEYDSYDPVRPTSSLPEVSRKRIDLAQRGNTDAWRTLIINLDDARFAGNLPGGADFRIGSVDGLILRNVAVSLIRKEESGPPPRVVIDGKEVAFDPDDAMPFIDPVTSRTLVPLRKMANALGITDENIKWNDETRTVELKRGQSTIMLTIDSKQALVNYLPVPELDQPAIIRNSRTFVPLRFVSEQFGLLVGWDGEQRLVTLTSMPPDPSKGPLPPVVPPTQP